MRLGAIAVLVCACTASARSASPANADSMMELGKASPLASTAEVGDIESLGWLSDYLSPSLMSGGDYSLTFSLDAVPRMAADDLTAAFAYPNPCRTYRGDNKITFSKLPREVYVRIFTITGELVFDRHVETETGDFAWPLLNNDGSSVASGVFVYLLKDTHGRTAVGKIAIIR